MRTVELTFEIFIIKTNQYIKLTSKNKNNIIKLKMIQI